jgi:hypothetical protein
MTAAPVKKRLKNMKNMWTCYQMDEIIGQGERLAIKILSEIYPKAILAKQVPLRELLSAEHREDMGERAKKETIDIVIFDEYDTIAVRVQDDRHKTKNFGIIDQRQKYDLENNGVIVIDIWKSDAPYLFKEKNIEKSTEEIKKIFSDYLE